MSYEQGVEAFKRSLAARDALQSGDLPTGLGQLDYGKGQSEYDLAQQFGSGARGAVNDYAGVEGDQYRQYAQAINDAASRVAQWWTPSTEADFQEQQALTDALGYKPPSYIGPNGETVTPTTYASAGVEPGPVALSCLLLWAPPLGTQTIGQCRKGIARLVVHLRKKDSDLGAQLIDVDLASEAEDDHRDVAETT
jgi:hypothetical protein